MNENFMIQSEAARDKALTLDEKLDAMAADFVMQVIAKAEKPLTSAQQSELFERTRTQIVIQRNQAIATLQEALSEIDKLQWHDLVPISLIDISQNKSHGKILGQVNTHHLRGLRDIFCIRFGSFFATRGKGWIYRPTSEQLLRDVRRYGKKKVCESIAQSFRRRMKPYQVGDNEGPSTDFMIELKSDIKIQINQMLEQV